MKRAISIFLLSAFTLFAACKKNNEETTAAFSTSIPGTWELRESSGAMLPPAYSPTGNGNLLRFTGSTYERFVNGQLLKSGKYIVIPDTTVKENVCLEMPPGLYTKRIVYDSNYTSTKQFIHIAENRLTFISGCYALDAGYSLVFEKVADPAQTSAP